ncbi:MAG: MFS transporter [Roseiflexaceae bacterium]|nr:MFS transporter [Roseiflexaceae bacterium]
MAAPDTTTADTPIAIPSVWSPPYRDLTIGLMLTITAAAFETLAVSTILPTITRELGGRDLYGWVFSAFLLTRLIGSTLAGTEVDRQGPAIPFLIGVGIFVAGLLLGGFAPSTEILLAGRVVQGLGSGVIGSVSYAIIARGYPESVRPRMLALNSTAWIVPGLIGPAIAGLIGDFVGWRWVFLGLVPIPLLAAALSLRALRSLARQEQGPRDWNGAITAFQLAFGTALLLIGLGQKLPWSVGLVAAGIAMSVPALRKLLPEGAFRAAPGLPAAVVCMGFVSMSFFGTDAFIPLALHDVRGLPSAVTGLALTAATITWTAGSWLLDRMVHRYSRRTFAVVGLALIVVGIGIGILVLHPELSPLIGIVAWSVAGLGIGLAYTTLSLATLDLAPVGREGSSAAALQVTDVLGSALGAGIGGVIIASYGNAAIASALQTQFLLMTAIAAIGMLIAMRLPGQRV